MKKTVLSLSLILSNTLLAGGISAPISLPSAKVLPKGVRNVSVMGVSTAPTQRFNNGSIAEPLGQALNQELSFANLLEGETDPVKKGQLKQKMLAAGLSENDSFGESLGEVDAQVQVTVPVFAIGLTRRWTSAIAVPVKKARVNIATSVNHQNSATHDAFLRTLENTGVAGKKAEFDDKIGDPINKKLEEFGYDPIKSSEEYSRLGDVKLINKFLAFEDKKNYVTLNMAVTLPTGEQADPNKVVDIPGGDQQTDVEIGVLHDFKFNDRVTLSLGSSYTIQFSDHIDTRVPERRSSKSTPDLENDVARDLGDIVKFESALKYSFAGINVGAGYTFQYKGADKYEGSEYAAERYDWLAKDSVQNMHSMQASIGYDTISLFKAKKFFAPMGIDLTHTNILAGKNIVSSSLTTLAFKMFF